MRCKPASMMSAQRQTSRTSGGMCGTALNAAMEFIPGSHTCGAIPWRKSEGPAVLHQELVGVDGLAAPVSNNLRAVMDAIERVRPASAKGRYVKKVTVSSTMGPGVKIAPGTLD